jgi:hypothetical protein
MRTYWFHILAHKSPLPEVPSTYTLARSIAPDRNMTGGAMPTVHHPSWEHLAAGLSSVGIHEEALRETKEDLDRTGGHAIPEVILSDEQLKLLGYPEDVAAA